MAAFDSIVEATLGFKRNLDATTDPTAQDGANRGYGYWALWANVTTKQVFVCVDPTPGAAQWTDPTEEPLGAGGFSVKESAQAATIGTLNSNGDINTVLYNPTGGASGRGQISGTLWVASTLGVDGHSLSTGDRLLLKDEQLGGGLGGVANGLWVVGIVGTAFLMERTTDFDEDAEVVHNSYVYVENGVFNAGSGWVLVNPDPVTVGGPSGDPLYWYLFSSVADITAGPGLGKVGTVLGVGAGSGILVGANDVAVDYGLLADINALAPISLPGSLDRAARADHRHAHGDRGVDPAGSQHDANQIDVEGTYANIGAPADLETVLAAVDAGIVAGSGDVSGPASSTNHTIPVWDGTTGKLLKDIPVGWGITLAGVLAPIPGTAELIVPSQAGYSPAFQGKLGLDTTSDLLVYSDSTPATRTVVNTDSIQTLSNKRRPVRLITGSGTVNDEDDIVFLNASGGAALIVLPTPVGKQGQHHVLKKIDASANAANVQTPAGGIDGSAVRSLDTQYESIEIVSTGLTWYIVG